MSLLMLGEIEAQNRTPDELQKELVKLYEPKLNEPEINVVVSSLANNRVYVGGEVSTPGLILIQGRLTALGAIMQAGGFIESSAKKSSVVVIRQQDGKQFARALDLRAALNGAETEPFYLQPYDIVYVPRTTIVHVNEFVAQYIDGIIPKHLNFSMGLYNQSMNTGKLKSSTNISLPSSLTSK
jgi:protein involved in polysaccharide export with SLBB domain